jgi:hypothetical protein
MAHPGSAKIREYPRNVRITLTIVDQVLKGTPYLNIPDVTGIECTKPHISQIMKKWGVWAKQVLEEGGGLEEVLAKYNDEFLSKEKEKLERSRKSNASRKRTNVPENVNKNRLFLELLHQYERMPKNELHRIEDNRQLQRLMEVSGIGSPAAMCADA